ncbi:putative anthocyanidin reductase [Drosera capensis]
MTTEEGACDGAKYCVTGASGYIGSWLVRVLLVKGYNVHAAVRDPDKVSYLLQKWDGGGLKLFKADLNEEGSFDEAVLGCDGVFHVAASMEFSVPAQPNIESYVQSQIIDPAIRGTLNLLKSCKKSKSVKRVVFTSSTSTITAKDDGGHWRFIVDESCLLQPDNVWGAKADGWVYALSKLQTEDAAFRYASENSIDLVSVVVSTVAGPFITSGVPVSIRVILSPITGDPYLSPILKAVNARMGSICLVHIEDICNAHIFLMEHPKAKGSYICSAANIHVSRLLQLLAKAYPSPNVTSSMGSELGTAPCEISSNKLKDLGFKYQYGVEEIINDTIKLCVECRYLPSLM